MRIVSYNILDGGEGRADVLGDVLEAQWPDVVALVEADSAEVIDRIAARLTMDLVHAPGNAHASALLSRFPVRESMNHAPLHPEKLEKSLLQAIVVDPSTRVEWTIGAVHLHAGGTEEAERRRERELDVVLGVFADHRRQGRPHLLCGDFNANAPHQRIDPAKCKPRSRRDWDENGGGLPRRVVRRLLDSGYKDSLLEVDLESACTRGSFSTEFPGQRVDYIFTFGFARERLKRAWIVYDPPAKIASDHYPVGLEIADQTA